MIKNKLTLTVVIVAIIGAGLWFGGNYFISNKIEEKLTSFVTKHQLSDHIKWEKVEGTINQKVTFYKMKLSDPNQNVIRIEQVKVNDFEENDQRILIDVELKGISDEHGKPLKREAGVSLKELGIENLPLLNAHFKFKQDKLDENTQLSLSADQGKLLAVDIGMDLRNINPLIDEIREKGIELDAFKALALVSNIALAKANLQIKEQGFFAATVKHRPEALPSLQECVDSFTLINSDKRKEYCELIVKFAHNQEKYLRISLSPKKPYSLIRLIDNISKAQNGYVDFDELLEVLNFNMSH